MTKYRGRVDCYINPPTPDSLGGGQVGIASRAVGEVFVNIVQHISSSGADLGIEMISANYGVGGTGLDFWDAASPVGRRGWACFRFHSASLGKFDCLVFQLTGSTTDAYGNPVAIAGSGAVASSGNYPGTLLGIAFASHPSGSNVTQSDGPWNGDYSLTSGTICNSDGIMWKVNAAGKGAFFPRENGILGTFSGSRGYMSPIITANYDYQNSTTFPNPMRLHIITSEDSLTIVSDGSNNGNHRILHFGSYTPRSGTTPVPESPYFMFVNSEENTAPIPNFYGGTAGALTPPSNPTDARVYGGMAHPNLTSGSRIFSFSALAFDQTVGYNGYVNSGSYELGNMFPTLVEAPNNYGVLGVANHIKVAVGPVNRSVSENSSSVAFGRDVLTEVKLVLPWSGDAPNTTAQVRTGRNFSIG